MEGVAQTVPIPENQTSVRFQLEMLTVEVTEIDTEEFQESGFSFDSGPSFETSASLRIPNNLFEGVMPQSEDSNSSVGTPRITNAVYLNDALFVRRGERNDSEVASVVIAASLSYISSTGEAQSVRVENLDPAITLVFDRDPGFVNVSNTSTCNFWDFSADGERNFQCITSMYMML